MQKGIGAAPFAIVAALIIALAGGLWATQPAQADTGDVLLIVDDVDVAMDNTFVDPGGTDEAAFGGGAAEVRDGSVGALPLEAGYLAADEDNVFRGELISGTHWVEFEASISANSDDSGNDTENTIGFAISVSGEASLNKASTLTSATCTPQEGICQFPVYGTGTAGDFSVTAAPAAGTALTAGGDGDPATKNGQWVGPAATATAITEDPEGGAAITGTLSPAVFLSGVGGTATAAGLGDGQVGFLFQLKDAGGRVAMSSDTMSTRDDYRVSVVVNTGEDVTIAGGLSLAADDGDEAVVYVDIRQESTLSTSATNYPTGGSAMGGLIAIGLTPTVGKGSIGVITIDLGRGELFEHPFAIAGDPDADMSSVGAAASPVNLGPGDSHKRLVTLRDANGTAVPLPASVDRTVVANASTAATPGSSELLILTDVTGDDEQISVSVAGDSEADSPGVYALTIKANEPVVTDAEADPLVTTGTDAKPGTYAFTVAIRDLATTVLGETPTGKEVTKKTTDANGDPLEAHVGSEIKGLDVASVTVRAEELELSEDREVTVAAHAYLTITLSAEGTEGRLPANGREVSPLSGAGFQLAISGAAIKKTNDVGEVTFGFRAGTVTETVAFDGDGAQIDLVIRIVDPDAPADAGPVIYSLASVASSTFHTWNGGDASSSEFENVANLVIVWKWTGAMWVGYVSSPNAPGATKTDFALANGDILWVVSTGPVDITLG